MKLLPLIFSLFCATTVFAQTDETIDFVGMVVDQATGTPIEKCKIQLAGTDGSVVDVYSDSAGKFVYTIDPNERYAVTASAANYRSSVIKTSSETKHDGGMLTFRLFHLGSYYGGIRENEE